MGSCHAERPLTPAGRSTRRSTCSGGAAATPSASRNIVDALGLNRGSLYTTYGDKEQLWLRALGRYCDLRNARLAELTADPAAPVLPRIRALMTDLTQPADGLPRGCLIVNAITERTADSATRDLALRQIGHVEETLRQALEGARDARRDPAHGVAWATGALPGRHAPGPARLRQGRRRSPRGTRCH